MKNWKIETAERIELLKYESIRKLEEKEIY